jgi:guanyl-specific ribonuclease Sa
MCVARRPAYEEPEYAVKYRTFRNVVAMVMFLALGGTCYGCYAWWHKSLAEEEIQRLAHEAERQKDAARVTAAQLAAATSTSTATNATAASTSTQHAASWLSASGLREVDTAALQALQRPVVAKIKDATKGKPYKINVYADDGARFNRLKIDLDRDEKDDESWTIFADGHIERKVSTSDNGTMDASFRLEQSGWVDMSAAPTPKSAPTSTATTAAGAAGGLRAVDNDVLALVAKTPVADKVKDATRGKPYKVNLYSDDKKVYNRAKIDLDRDDKWDESWTWKGSQIERQVSPSDNEQFTEVWILSAGAWRKK